MFRAIFRHFEQIRHRSNGGRDALVISWLVRECRNMLLRISEDRFWIDTGDPGLVFVAEQKLYQYGFPTFQSVLYTHSNQIVGHHQMIPLSDVGFDIGD